ncbi:sensor histidine kinase [Niveispirillum fermenti]|uniref:sensor histidine kinase n=1 Tax=Niveispirillum fermenti TaxID=1233113 RepID=UPI003A848FFA
MTDLFLPAVMRQPGFDEKQLLRARAFIRVTLLIHVGLLVLYAVWAVRQGPFDPVSLAWAGYAAILGVNLVLVRLTGRFHEVTIANNLAGLSLIAMLLHFTGGIASPLVPLFLMGVATTGNFGGNRAILVFFAGFIAVIAGTYGWQLYTGSHADDVHSRFAFLLTAVVLLVLANLSSQSARTKTRLMLQRARDAAIDGRRKAEEARAQAERTLDELRAAQAQMILQEKMASLGGMVAGVAHEVNTPVGLAVTGASQLKTETARIMALAAEGKLRRSTFDEYLTVVDELAGLIEKNAVRAAELIQSFKEVAVDQSSDARRPYDLRAYVAEVLASLSPRVRRAGHRVEMAVPEGIEMDGYPGAMAQIVTNLVINSIMHAYPGERAGVMRLSARLLEDGRVEMTYGDDGQGIPPDLWPRIFEPFFTTRRGTGGSGLGLHLLYNIVTVRMGGTVHVGASPQGGALFTLVFPRVAPGSRSAQQQAAPVVHRP